jgi:NADH-quinone oxidoreductase subunit M
MFGPIKNKENEDLKDLSFREMVVMAPLLVAIFAMGVFPNFFFEKMEPSIQRFLERSSAGLVTQSDKPAQPESAVALFQD